MYLVVRRCSAYTTCDIMIGLYTTIEAAVDAVEVYIEALEQNGDKYAKQAYHDVDLDADVEVVNVEHEPTEAPVYLLLEYGDMMGQVYARPLLYHTSFERVKERYHREKIDESVACIYHKWDRLVPNAPVRFDNEMRWFTE
jgi:hypothetical protein